MNDFSYYTTTIIEASILLEKVLIFSISPIYAKIYYIYNIARYYVYNYSRRFHRHTTYSAILTLRATSMSIWV